VTLTIDAPEPAGGLAPGERTVDLVLHTAPGTVFAAGAPLSAAIEVSRGADVLTLLEAALEVPAVGGAVQPVAIPVHVAELPGAAASAELLVTLEHVLCDAGDEAACAAARVRVRVPVPLAREGGRERLSLRVTLPARA